MATTQAKKTKKAGADYEAEFQAALSRLSFKSTNLPPTVQGNRSAPYFTMTERELQEQTRLFFEQFEAQCTFYTERLGQDVMWLLDWAKTYWAAWSGGVNEELVRATVAENCEYKDPLSFGRTMYGIQAFIDYNQAFFDSSPDMAYYLIPGQFAIQVSAEGETTLLARYVGAGHWDHPLRMYPFTEGAPEIPGTGCFIQMYPVDRYHFDADHKVCRGETLWDPLEALQIQGLFPSDTSLAFKAMVRAGKITTPAFKLARRLPLIGG